METMTLISMPGNDDGIFLLVTLKHRWHGLWVVQAYF